MATHDAGRPLASVVTQIVSDLSFLLQTEIRLARSEIREKLGDAANAGTFIAAAAVLALGGLIVLLFAVVRWLEVAGLPSQWGLTIVGLVVAAGGLVLARIGMNRLSGSALVPDRTIEQVRADLSVAKEHV
jgi:hypothetical protein